MSIQVHLLRSSQEPFLFMRKWRPRENMWFSEELIVEKLGLQLKPRKPLVIPSSTNPGLVETRAFVYFCFHICINFSAKATGLIFFWHLGPFYNACVFKIRMSQCCELMRALYDSCDLQTSFGLVLKTTLEIDFIVSLHYWGSCSRVKAGELVEVMLVFSFGVRIWAQSRHQTPWFQLQDCTASDTNLVCRWKLTLIPSISFSSCYLDLNNCTFCQGRRQRVGWGSSNNKDERQK